MGSADWAWCWFLHPFFHTTSVVDMLARKLPYEFILLESLAADGASSRTFLHYQGLNSGCTQTGPSLLAHYWRKKIDLRHSEWEWEQINNNYILLNILITIHIDLFLIMIYLKYWVIRFGGLFKFKIYYKLIKIRSIN